MVYCHLLLSKTVARNKGEVAQHYVENSHEGIVSKEIFDMVQDEIKRRRSYTGDKYISFSSNYALTGIVFCAECDKRGRTFFVNFFKSQNIEDKGTVLLSSFQIPFYHTKQKKNNYLTVLFLFVWRRERDLNPCTGVTRLPHFQCGPLSLLGISAYIKLNHVALATYRVRKHISYPNGHTTNSARNLYR